MNEFKDGSIESDEHPLVRMLKALGVPNGDADCSTCSVEDCEDRDAPFSIGDQSPLSEQSDGMPRPKDSDIPPGMEVMANRLSRPRNSDINPEAINRHDGSMSRKDVILERQRSLRARSRSFKMGLKYGEANGTVHALIHVAHQAITNAFDVAVQHGYESSDPDMTEGLKLVRNVLSDLTGMSKRQFTRLQDKV